MEDENPPLTCLSDKDELEAIWKKEKSRISEWLNAKYKKNGAITLKYESEDAKQLKAASR